MNHCNLSFEAVEWLNGELLGDGYLGARNLKSARFEYYSKYLEYIQYVRDTLSTFGVEQSGKINKNHSGYGSIGYAYHSRFYVELLPLRMEWYPEGKKEVPGAISLTPLTCRQWYIGDGSFHKRDKVIRLHTNAFPVPDVIWLINQLTKIGVFATRHASTNIIYIPYCFVEKFLSYIGKCPVECYKYKWAQVE